MKSGSTSIDRQADTHTPQWMQAIAWVTSSVADAGVAGERRLAVDAYAAGAADRGAAGAADRERGVLAVLHLEDAVEHRAFGRQVHVVVGPVGRLGGLGVE